MLTERQFQLIKLLENQPQSYHQLLHSLEWDKETIEDVVNLCASNHFIYRNEPDFIYRVSGIGAAERRAEEVSRTTFRITKATFACSIASLVIAAASLVISVLVLFL